MGSLTLRIAGDQLPRHCEVNQLPQDHRLIVNRLGGTLGVHSAMPIFIDKCQIEVQNAVTEEVLGQCLHQTQHIFIFNDRFRRPPFCPHMFHIARDNFSHAGRFGLRLILALQQICF